MACQIAHAAKPKSRATCMLEDDLGLQDTRTKILQDFSAHKNVNRNTPNIVISTHPWLCPCGGNRERWRQLPYLHARTSARTRSRLLFCSPAARLQAATLSATLL